MNTKIFFAGIAVATALTIYSCDDSVSKPSIVLTEVGEGDSHGNDHTAFVGGELHVEAEIVAEGKINKVTVKLHPESEHAKSVMTEGWEIDTTYTKFSGLKNTTFHEHLDIATSAIPGDYHFDMIVTDYEGNESSVEVEVKIVSPLQ